jgi:excisionase family DNA binding protein
MKDKALKNKELDKELRIYEVEELADILKIAEVTVRRYVREGKIKGFKQGNRVFVTEDNVKEYLKSLQNQED